MTTFKIELTFDNREYAENILELLCDWDMEEICPPEAFEVRTDWQSYGGIPSLRKEKQ